jgi:hypothetical protein
MHFEVASFKQLLLSRAEHDWSTVGGKWKPTSIGRLFFSIKDGGHRSILATLISRERDLDGFKVCDLNYNIQTYTLKWNRHIHEIVIGDRDNAYYHHKLTEYVWALTPVAEINRNM